ncbi:MAG: Uma2 family endonuclease [Acidimicrobiales bacterium]
MSTSAMRPGITVGEYYRMAEDGALAPGQRVELIDGEVVEMSPIGSRHAATVDELTRLLVPLAGHLAVVRIQNPVRLSDLTELQPDIALVRPRADRYLNNHPVPADVQLIIEVADTSQRFDRTTKRPMYAAAGIVEVWIVDLVAGLVEIATDPGPNGYRSIRQVGRNATITPTAGPGMTLAVADFLP